MLAAMALTLLDWRRQVARLYADVRSASTPVEGHDTWRAGRDRLFAEHPDSPLEPADRARFAGLPVAPYDPSLRFDVEVDTDVEPTRWEVATDGDGAVPFTRVGVAHLPGLGDLDVWWLESYGGGVFVPVRDTAADTYGGGNAAAGHLVLDLNFAYNPSCAYSPAWTCPLAPAGNTLTVPLPGGERVRAAVPEAE
jgi:uncharacterized protein